MSVNGDILRAIIELTAEYRKNASTFMLDINMIIANGDKLILVFGTQAHEMDLAGVGSGSLYALQAARALMRHSSLDARSIVYEAVKIAAEFDPYTNDNITMEVLPR